MIGKRLAERYELLEKLGAGGMGVVYRARDPYLEREVAVKVVSAAFDEEVEARFRREARLVAQMDHPAVLPIHDFGNHEGTLFFVMPIVEGKTIKEVIEEGGLSVREAVLIAAEAAEGLAHAHERGVIHRDVKPANIMVARENGELRTRVMDFGLARRARDASHTGGLMGTPAYLSPEMVKGKKPDARSDLYALGAVLYECLASEPPFDGPLASVIYRIGHTAPLGLRQRGLEIDEDLDRIVLQCLAKDPSERPADARELAARLKAYLRPGATRSETASSPGNIEQSRPGLAELLPLVGRTNEWSRIGRRFDSALGGECQLVLIGGEAGVGKSRLLQEIESLAGERLVRVLHGRYSDLEQSFHFEGLCELVQDYFRNLSSQDSASPPDLADLAPELLALFPVLSEIPELRDALAGAPHPPDHSSAGPTYVFELFARTLIRLSDSRPLVILLENLHEADASIEALKYLVHRLAPTPMVIAGTYRPAQTHRGHPLLRWIRSLRDHPRALTLTLEPLPPEELAKLAELWIGSPNLREDLVERLCEATEGNPLFARELIRSLLETGSLVQDRGGFWALTGEATLTEHGALPRTLQQAVEHRLELLPDELRGILAVAAVMGKSFDATDLDELAGNILQGESDLDDAIDQLLEHGILREDRKARGDRLVFVSGLVRTVLYHDLSRRRRRLLHRRYARYLEKTAAGRLERYYPALVRHFSAGDVPEKTVEYALAQARWSLSAWNPDDAIRAARIALEFVDEDEIEDPHRASGEIFMTLARAHRVLGQNVQAFEEAGRAVDAFREAGLPEPTARAAWLATGAAWQGRRIDETRLWVDKTAELARAAGTRDLLKRVLLLGSTVANLRGEADLARRYREDAAQLAASGGAAEDSPNEAIPRGGTLRVALPITNQRLDPAELDSDENGEVVSTVFETLLRLDGEGNLLPALAADWRGSRDGRLFELTLARGVRFSDSHELNAQDVRRSFERLARHRTEAPPAALAALAGRDAFLSGESGTFSGIEVDKADAHRLLFHLSKPLPMFPVLLSDPYTAITRELADERLVGTGPFLLEALEDERTVLGRNPHFRAEPTRIDRLEFRTSLDATRIAEGLSSGELDLGRDLLLCDLEDLLRDPRFRAGLVETTRKNVHFLLWNLEGPLGRHREVRQALNGVLELRELVWQTLGRFAQPAVCLVPPGTPAHDPGRRHPKLTLEAARGILSRAREQARLSSPLRLRAAIHPVFRNRGREMVRALFETWARLGVEVDLARLSIDDYLETYQVHHDIDFLLGRWNADYDDPDSFTFGLFHSQHGVLRRYFSSVEGDRLLEAARKETSTPERVALYQRFEHLLEDQSACVPLFHDVSYRVAGPRVRGLALANVSPYVNYAEVGKEEDVASRQGEGRWHLDRGELHVPIVAPVASLDPVGGSFAEHFEVCSAVFEGLTRLDENAGVVPWLAQKFESSPDGRRFHLHLRPGVRFHDGRRLTARDVRYSFERALAKRRTGLHFLLLPIRGARALRDGRASDLAGLEIRSTHEIVIELEEAVPFFPALLAHPGASIVAEGSESFTSSWRDGCVGTGPFRVLRFEPDGDVDLERHPQYWRPGYPRSERLSFHCGLDTRRIAAGFRQGDFSLASDLQPSDVEALRRDPRLAGGCLEAPRLSTILLVLNSRRGPLADERVRRSLAREIDVESLFRKSAGPQAQRAHGLIPPGLVGHEEPRPSRGTSHAPAVLEGLKLKVAAIPTYIGQYASVLDELKSCLTRLGILVEVIDAPVSELIDMALEGVPDLLFFRWLADFPDPDSFVSGLLHSDDGILSGMCSHPEIDRLSERGRREHDPALRHAAYREIEEHLDREALVVPLLHEQSYRFMHPSIEGVKVYFALPEIRYEEIRVRR